MLPNQSKDAKGHVDLFALRDGAAVLIARVRLADGAAVSTGEPEIVAELSAGITDPLSGTSLAPSDGLAFLRALSSVYRTPYLYATDVIEGE